jgi:hypothetical protein
MNVGNCRALNWLNIKYTTIHAIQKYGPVAQPGRVPDFYHFGRNPAVSGSNPDGPVIKLVLKKDSRTRKIVFIFAINSPSTKEKCIPRLFKFFEFIDLNGDIEVKCSNIWEANE